VTERSQRPSDFAPRTAQVEAEPLRPCPFCPGHEGTTPPALETWDEGGRWRVRVVPNLYPAFDGNEPFAVHHLGPVHSVAEASGIHEVLVYTPDHDGGLHLLDDHAAGEVMQVLRRRLVDHAAMPNVRYTQAIVNHGREAGASLAHPHGQLLGLPFVPGEILDEERAFARFHGSCVMCTTAEAELADADRVVFANDEVVVVCPFWSGMPFELLIIPRHHELHLQDASDQTLHAVGMATRDVIRHLREAVGDVAYNVVFHTAPHQHSGEYHWHIHLLPKLVTTAGFEAGTGVLINIVSPETAAATLRRVSVVA
jgi:UDPglucose--hexose-1-phosphate uridylyltransferase